MALLVVLFFFFFSFFFGPLLVDCVRVFEFNHGFVYVFACLDAQKMK